MLPIHFLTFKENVTFIFSNKCYQLSYFVRIKKCCELSLCKILKLLLIYLSKNCNNTLFGKIEKFLGHDLGKN